MVLGLSAEEAAAQAARAGPPVPAGAEVIGRWKIDGRAGGDVLLYRVGSAYTFHQLYPDGSGDPESVRKVKSPTAGTAYKSVDGGADIWVVTPAGELQGWDREGRIEWATGKPSTR